MTSVENPDEPTPAQHLSNAAPPTTPGPLGERGLPTVWPTVVGAIAIVFGILGILAALMSVAGPILMDSISGAFGASAPPPVQAQFKAAAEWMPVILGVNALNAGVAAVLLVGGVLVVRRRPRGPGVVRAWAVLRILSAIPGVVVAYRMQADQLLAMQASQPSVPGPPAGFVGAMALVTVGLGLAWPWALPAFMLVWFWLPRVRAEARSWR